MMTPEILRNMTDDELLNAAEDARRGHPLINELCNRLDLKSDIHILTQKKGVGFAASDVVTRRVLL